MNNRRAILELYTVPEECEGRRECSGVITAEGRLIKQNLMLTLIDIDREESERLQCGGHCGIFVYQTDFYDSKPISCRMEEIAKTFGGTNSRRTNGYYDDASFAILDRDKLIEYIQKLESTPIRETALPK